nr:MAG: replication associated protein [Cressdnaviricota sp.]
MLEKNVPQRWWMLTIPFDTDWTPTLPAGCGYIKGQRELAASGYQHWQVVARFDVAQRLAGAKRGFPIETHAEATRSEAALSYVWKEETSVDGTRFELGHLRPRTNNKLDWDIIRRQAQRGELEDIDSSIYVRYYNNLRRISAQFAVPVAMERRIYTFWGDTGTGKSTRAWELGGMHAYPKNPRSVFWDGYNGQAQVIVDEFCGGIDISHILRWTDRYPLMLEIKGSSQVAKYTTLYFTSNLHPDDWYPLATEAQRGALRRRMTITEFKVLAVSS